MTNTKFHLTCNEESGTRTDSHGSFNFTSNNGVGFTAGKFGNAAAFVKASNQHLSHPYSPALGVSGHISFMFGCWVSVATHGDCIASHYQFRGGETSWRLISRDSGEIALFLGPEGDPEASAISAAVSLNTPLFVLGWHDADNDVVGVRVNDVETTSAHSTGISSQSKKAFRIGAQGDNTVSGAVNFFDGWIDWATFWKGTIPNAAERDLLYADGNGTNYFNWGSDGPYSRGLRRGLLAI